MEQEKLKELRTITFAMEETFEKEGYKFLNITYMNGDHDSLNIILEMSSLWNIPFEDADESYSSSFNLVFYDEDGSYITSKKCDFYLGQFDLSDYFHLEFHIDSLPYQMIKSIRLYLAPSSCNFRKFHKSPHVYKDM